MKYLKLLLLIPLWLPLLSLGQQDLNRLEKYWHIRQNFLNKYVRVCDDPNDACDSWTTAYAQYNFCDTASWVNNLSGSQITTYITQSGWGIPGENISPGRIVFGADGTTDLGWWIAVLASEYRLLKDNNQPTHKTEWELYAAFRAFERMDYAAEHIFGNQLSASETQYELNGFFARGDATRDFLPEFLPEVYQECQSASPYINLYDLHYKNSESIKNRGCMSQDQVVHMMFGFAHVINLVDPWAFKNGINFVDDARDHVDRMVSYMRDHHNWKIYVPEDRDSIPGEDHAVKVKDGPDARFMAWAFAAAAHELVNGGNGTNPYDVNTSNALWGLASNYAWFVFARDDNRVMPMILAAIGDLKSDLWQNHMGYTYDSYIYPLVREVFHNSFTSIPDGTYLGMLDDMDCDGPRYKAGPNQNDHAAEGWRVRNRWRYPSDAKDGNDSFTNYFPGLDYMLLYNLFHIAKPHRLPECGYLNLMREGWVGGNFPKNAGPGCIGCISNPREYRFQDEVTADMIGYHDVNVSGQSAKVSLRAENRIKLTPGFKVQKGAEFKAYLAPVPCVNWENEGEGEGEYDPGIGISPEELAQSQAELDSLLDSLGITLDQLDSLISGNLSLDEIGSKTENLTVQPENSELALLAYPSPASQELKYELQTYSPGKLQLINSSGIVAASIQVPGDDFRQSGRIPVRNLPSGLYFLRLITPEGAISRQIQILH